MTKKKRNSLKFSVKTNDKHAPQHDATTTMLHYVNGAQAIMRDDGFGHTVFPIGPKVIYSFFSPWPLFHEDYLRGVNGSVQSG